MQKALGFIILSFGAYALVTGGKSGTAPTSAPTATYTQPVALHSAPQAILPPAREDARHNVAVKPSDAPAPSAPLPFDRSPTLANARPAAPALAIPNPAPAETRTTVEVKSDRARLRAAPNGRFIRGGKLRQGTLAVEIGRTGTWRELRFPDGRRGWLEAKFFDTPDPTSSEPKPTREIKPPSIDGGLAAAAIAVLIVQESRASYGGSCGCPDDRDRAGRRCGGRSAYARAGGRSLMCYAADVPASLISRRQASR